MELPKLSHIQIYITPFEIDYGNFERQPQSQQSSLSFTSKIKEIFEILETEDIDMTPYHSMIEPIVNMHFGNKFHHQNVPNNRQHTKNTPVNRNKTEILVNTIKTEILVNSINPYPFKDSGPHQSHT